MNERPIIDYGNRLTPRAPRDWWSWFCLSLIPLSFLLIWGANQLLELTKRLDP